MLGNNERIENVDYGELFARMVKELPWSGLCSYVQGNAALLKTCTLGGHRLVPQKRDRVERIVCKEAARAEYSESVCNGVFASWYPVHEALHKDLEDYFHSDWYKGYRSEHQLGEEDYVLPDEKFSAVFRPADLVFWKLLLCFSPLRFNEEQARRILDTTAGSEELLERIAALTGENEELRKRNDQLQGEGERLRARQQSDAGELQELKRTNRGMKADLEAMGRKYESAQAEARRLGQRLEDSSTEVEGRIAQAKDDAARQVARVQGELDRVARELAGWQVRYEEQRLANRGCEDKAAAAVREARDVRRDSEAAVAKAEGEVREMRAALRKRERFADLVLGRIDWAQIGAAMKLSPAVRRNFNSLVKKLNYEEDMSLTLEDTLAEFWRKLTDVETALVSEVANSNALESMNGDLDGFWQKLEGGFDLVEANLEAKMAMLGILRGIFYQEFSDEDLAQPVIPPLGKGR